MNNVKHTPGPWRVDTDTNTLKRHLVADGIPIRAYSKRYDQYLSILNLKANDEFGGIEGAIANAQLIAQAPTFKAENKALKAANAELLSACVKSRAWIAEYLNLSNHRPAAQCAVDMLDGAMRKALNLTTEVKH